MYHLKIHNTLILKFALKEYSDLNILIMKFTSKNTRSKILRLMVYFFFVTSNIQMLIKPYE